MILGLRWNAIAAAVEQLIVGGTFFAIYAVLIRTVGAEITGLLSLVLVLASFGAMASLGFGGALMSFVPIYEGRGDRTKSVRAIESATVCTIALYTVVIALVFYPFQLFIVAQAGPEYAELGRAMLIPATVYVFGMGIVSVTMSALTALQRNDLRLIASVIGAGACLSILAVAVARFGAVGALWALVAQMLLVLVSSWIFLKRRLSGLPWIPHRLFFETAFELLGRGFNLQLQALLTLALEPVSRLLIGGFGTLTQVAYFSMSARFVMQVRTILFSAAQPILPMFSYLREKDPAQADALYIRFCSGIGLASLLVLSATAGASPFIGEAWIGSMQSEFVTFSVIQTIGWLGVTVILGPYFNAYSLGFLRYNLVAHIVLAIANAFLGSILGLMFGSVGVVAALSVSLLVAGGIMGVGNAKLRPGIRIFNLRADLAALVGCAAAAGVAIAIYQVLRTALSPIESGIGSGIAWLLVAAPVAMFHPGGTAFFRRSHKTV